MAFKKMSEMFEKKVTMNQQANQFEFFSALARQKRHSASFCFALLNKTIGK